MNKTVSVKTIEQNDNVSLYSICFDGNKWSEYEKFLTKFKDNAKLNRDFQTIILAMAKIIEHGALERFFRNEGKINDNLCALSIDSRKLRLYCLRISNQILIVGNGGEKNDKNLPRRRAVEWLCDGSSKIRRTIASSPIVRRNQY